jgi:hypothetical protein
MEWSRQRISIAAHVTGIKFGSLQVKQCPMAPANVWAKIIQEEEVEKRKQLNGRQNVFKELWSLVLELQLQLQHQNLDGYFLLQNNSPIVEDA